MPKSKRFAWHPDDPPPEIEEHSKAKLDVLRRYLRAYFDKLNIGFARDAFRLDLVDGFAGGGIFRDGRETVPGTPLIMLEESDAAESRLNQRRKKLIAFDFKYYFIDIEKAHTDHLKKVLKERGYLTNDRKIVVRNASFKDAIDGVIAGIRRRQPKAGRSLFLLDQTGFSQVELALVSRIFRELPKAEVILTFAAETLINFLREHPRINEMLFPLDLTEKDIKDLTKLKESTGGRALVSRGLIRHIQALAGATYYTPFFIRPEKSRRALWFVHLSRHPTARNEMIQCHWESSNTFEHQGSGGFGMLGYDALKSGENLPLFRFGGLEERDLKRQLLDTMPQELRSLASEDPITLDAVHREFANRTAATLDMLNDVIRFLNKEKEIDILDPDGRKRRRNLKHLKPTDRIAFSQQLPILGFPRRRKR